MTPTIEPGKRYNYIVDFGTFLLFIIFIIDYYYCYYFKMSYNIIAGPTEYGQINLYFQNVTSTLSLFQFTKGRTASPYTFF